MEVERVVVELLARVEGFDQKIKQSASAFEGSIGRIQKAGSTGEAAVSRSYAGMSQAQKMFGNQLNDIGHLLQSSSSPFAIVTKNAPISARAFGLITAGASTLGGVLGGIAVQGATALISSLIEMATKGNSANAMIAEMVEKLKESAEKSELARQAEEAFGRTAEGAALSLIKITEALDTQNRSLEENIALTKQKIQQDIGSVRRGIAIEERNLAQAKADLRAARAAEGAAGAVGSEGAANDGIRRAQNRVQEVSKLLAKLRSGLAGGERSLFTVDLPLLERTAEAAADPIKQIGINYDNMRHAAEKAAAANKSLRAGLQGVLTQIEKNRAAALGDERARTKTTKTNTDVGDRTSFISPVQGGRVVGQFGEKRPGHRHAGVDLAVPVGTKVVAPAGGVVVESGNLPGYGNVIFIDHGRGTITRLAHLSQLGAKKGDVVSQGQVVGLSGGAKGAPGSGNSQGPHVHQETRVNGRAVDPRRGVFNTDSASVATKAASLAAQAERAANQEAERQRREENVLAGLNERYAAERDNFNKDLIARKDLGATAQAEAKRLNDATAELAKQLIDRAEAEKRFRAEQERRQRDLTVAEALNQNQQDLLQSQAGLARTQAERREIELKILALAFEEEKLRAQAVIAARDALAAELAKKAPDKLTANDKRDLADANASAVVAQDQLSTLPQRQANATAGVMQGSAGPLQQLFDQLPQTAAEISEAFETIAANGLNSLADGITDAITGAKSFGEAFKGVAQSVIRDLIAMTVKMLLFRAISAAVGGGGGGIGGALAGIFGGGMSAGGSQPRASGGPVTAGRSYLDGERGAERFVPGSNGRIIPNNSRASPGGGQRTTVVQKFTIDARYGITTPELLRHVNGIASDRAREAGIASYDAGQRSVPERIERYNKLGS